MKTDNPSDQDQLLVASFHLGQAVFGIDAQQVQEVARLGETTPVRHAPADVVGIRNLRGRIITVLDLRARLQLGHALAGPNSRILIVDWSGEPVGLLVDKVGDTFTTKLKDLVPPPPNMNGVQSRNLRGVFAGGGRLVALIDPGALLRLEESPPPSVARQAA